jgi:catechol 2,3-dioxygenase-like lactoylglutathione lyase family enzyme
VPVLDQANLIVRDMEQSLAFYRALGLTIPEASIWRTASGAHHVDIEMPNGFELALDSYELARKYNQGQQVADQSVPASRSVLSFRVETRADVDRIHDALVSLGHIVSQEPCDTFWGSRYAIVLDPDGNQVGIMSPRDPALRTRPPDI